MPAQDVIDSEPVDAGSETSIDLWPSTRTSHEVPCVNQDLFVEAGNWTVPGCALECQITRLTAPWARPRSTYTVRTAMS